MTCDVQLSLPGKIQVRTLRWSVRLELAEIYSLPIVEPDDVTSGAMPHGAASFSDKDVVAVLSLHPFLQRCNGELDLHVPELYRGVLPIHGPMDNHLPLALDDVS